MIFTITSHIFCFLNCLTCLVNPSFQVAESLIRSKFKTFTEAFAMDVRQVV